jgi:membrane-associated protein
VFQDHRDGTEVTMHLSVVTTLALNPLDARSLLSSLGALGVFLVLFAETGLLIGFFLPG